MRNSYNAMIRELQKQYHLYNYEIAKLLHVSESTFTRMMRSELPEEEQKRIAELIRKNSESKEV